MSGSQEEDKKPGDQSAHINLKVKGQVSLFLPPFFPIRVFVPSLWYSSRVSNFWVIGVSFTYYFEAFLPFSCFLKFEFLGNWGLILWTILPISFLWSSVRIIEMALHNDKIMSLEYEIDFPELASLDSDFWGCLSFASLVIGSKGYQLLFFIIVVAQKRHSLGVAVVLSVEFAMKMMEIELCLDRGWDWFE